MGVNFGYEMWVPQDRLYEFLDIVNKRAAKEESTILHWWDGRTLEFAGSLQSSSGERLKEVAFDCSLRNSFTICLLCEPDEVLRASKYSYSIDESGKYKIDHISLEISLSPHDVNWLEEEGYYAHVFFRSGVSKISFDFDESPNIRRLFVDLARAGRAISCAFYNERFSDRVFFLDGKEMDVKLDVEDDDELLLHFHSFRRRLYASERLSENQKIIRLYQHTNEFSHHDLMERIQHAYNHEDSGIRAAACKSLVKVKSDEIETILCEIASGDKDWRVRYVAIYCLGGRESKLSEETLSKALYDENYQVRIAAIQIIANCRDRMRGLADKLENLVATLPFRGPSIGAFYKAMKYLAEHGEPHHAQIIHKRMNEPNFPFEWEAKQAIERLESKS